MKVLLLDPYHTGSHAHWSRGLQQSLSKKDFTCDLWTLPGRHWKWRMHGACGAFARKAAQHTGVPDVIIATDMLNVASLRGLLPPDWRHTPIILYFHENQLTFPWSPEDQEKSRGLHHTYEFINIQSAAAADWIWFNSEFHRQMFLEAAERFMHRMPDETAMYDTGPMREKSSVLPVGIPAVSQPTQWRPLNPPPVILWNHRWEYDKGPDRFFEHLCHLENNGIEFKLCMCGKRFKKTPPALLQIEERFGSKIEHNGYAATREAYQALLLRSDFIVHDPAQEYFGISVAEAMSHGVIPLVKDDQAYTTWMPRKFRFCDSTELVETWHQLTAEVPDARAVAHATAASFFWPVVAHDAAQQIKRVLDRHFS